MTHEELLEIWRRAEAATAGPWASNGSFRIRDSNGITVARIRAKQEYRFTKGTIPGSKESASDDRANAEFIAHAREDIPRLLAEIKRLKADQ